MSKAEHAHRALEIALSREFPERYRFDEPFVAKNVSVHGSTCQLDGSWSGHQVSASVSRAEDSTFAIALTLGDGFTFIDIDLREADAS
ncbi:MAG: hypothetical protein WC813_04920 [Patescibacteria group bacterium]|jgi:hypothetical protein